MGELKTQPKKVNFDFFQVWIKSHDGNIKPFDLDDWSEKLPSDNLDERNIRYSGDIIRCDKAECIHPEDHPLTILHFNRLRNSTAPAVATLSTPELTDVELKDNEYIAEDISALFDSTNCVLMLQRNIFSLSVNSLAKYVNYFWNVNKEEEKMDEIEFRPVLIKDAFKTGLKAKRINKFTFKTANVVRGTGVNNIFKSGIGKAIEALETYSGVDVEVTISTTRSKESVLDKEAVHQSIEEIKAHQINFKKAILTSGDEGHSVPIQLINGRLNVDRTFDVPLKKFLDPETVQQDMEQIYSEKYDNFKKEVEDNLVKIPN
ncbi:MAG TPA: hypothetical protein K8V00_07420 [Ligilactobacillus acidipiscis]|uniref:Uncharacterized protein n=1 Tax=Ligilactobacillus acidipiscis TaxID=89059 RepID=A0A921F9G8_9LACO|nr:hypothetical protein [Ligilactobacillus acidipiscis]